MLESLVRSGLISISRDGQSLISLEEAEKYLPWSHMRGLNAEFMCSIALSAGPMNTSPVGES